MGIVMVAMLAFGGTFAYFTAKATGSSATATLGTVRLENSSATKVTAKGIVLPKAEIIKAGDVALKNYSNVETFVFVKVVTAKGGDVIDVTYPTTGEGAWTALEGETGVYYRELSAVTSDSEDVAFGLTVTVKDLQDSWTQADNKTSSDKGYMGQEIEVTVEISSIQKMNGSAAYTPAAAYAAIASQTL